VKESGEGYTLSGKELDPDSAAARPYLKRKQAATPNAAILNTAQTDNTAGTSATITKKTTPVKKRSSSSTPKKPKMQAAQPEESERDEEDNEDEDEKNEETEVYEADGRTRYSKSRLRQSRPAENPLGWLTTHRYPLYPN
jgi:protein MYSM1